MQLSPVRFVHPKFWHPAFGPPGTARRAETLLDPLTNRGT